MQARLDHRRCLPAAIIENGHLTASDSIRGEFRSWIGTVQARCEKAFLYGLVSEPGDFSYEQLSLVSDV